MTHHVIAAEPGWRAVWWIEPDDVDPEGTLIASEAILAWAIEIDADDGLRIYTYPITLDGYSDANTMWGFLRPDGAVETAIGEFTSLDKAAVHARAHFAKRKAFLESKP